MTKKFSIKIFDLFPLFSSQCEGVIGILYRELHSVAVSVFLCAIADAAYNDCLIVDR